VESGVESGVTLLDILRVLTPILVFLLGGVGWLYKHEREKRLAAEQQVSERKYKAYVALLDIFFDQFKAMRHNRQLPMDELVDRMADANRDLMLYASDGVLSLYNHWLDESRRGVVDMEQFGELIVAIRRDMGHPKTRIKAEEVLRQMLTDYDKMKAQGGLRVQAKQKR
jgi:predicted DNA-binding ribbon-helix-helix protein